MRKPYVKGSITCAELESSVTKVNGCWEWKYSKQRGYGVLRRHGKSWGVHRISYFMFNKNVDMSLLNDPSIYICHLCDNPPCINPTHLFLGNEQINKADAVKKRRHIFGERVPQSNLRETDILKIFHLRANGMSIADLSRKFDISYSGIKFVLNRINWKHVKIPQKLITKTEKLNAKSKQ